MFACSCRLQTGGRHHQTTAFMTITAAAVRRSKPSSPLRVRVPTPLLPLSPQPVHFTQSLADALAAPAAGAFLAETVTLRWKAPPGPKEG